LKKTLITGGARSGKSHFAQDMAHQSGKSVLFVATAQAGDDEMRRRIEAHRRSRPSSWRTLEASVRVGLAIQENIGGSELVLLDCVTLLVNNVIGPFLSPDGNDIDEAQAEHAVKMEIDQLLLCVNAGKADFLVVTNEVGLGLVPDNKLGRVYRDILGNTNQVLASAADEVYFMISGLPSKLKPWPTAES
jgi:adenosylcobinamide kinase / adenosylcobinamide-phosphate guanylyltransferase